MRHYLRIAGLMALCVALPRWSASAQDELPPAAPEAATTKATETPEGMEVLTSGPLHEAFAEAVRYKAEPGIVVDREPPALIEEQPPESRPAGADVIWIPGYWGWDDERGDFIWITGVYRNRPPGHRWVPGYWAPMENQWQWVSGFWLEDEIEEVTYLPEPPDTLDNGPSSPSPGSDYFWNPGCWLWGDSSYYWRAGYWARYQPNWIWTPTYYTWTPRGYVCVNGRWDRPWATRGLCFAPVYYSRPLYTAPGYYYRPWVVFNTASFVWNLFARPGYGHYYCGDYFGSRYYNRYGFVPWYAYRWGGGFYNPYYNYYRWSYGRRNPRWDDDLRDRYARMEDRDDRIPRDFREYRDRWDRLDQRDRVAATLTDLQRNRVENDVRLVRRERSDDQVRQAARQFRELNERRRQTEAESRERGRTAAERTRRDVEDAVRGRLELPPTERTQARIEGRGRASARSRGGEFADQRERADRERREFTNAPRERSQAAPRDTRSYRAFRDEQGNVVVPDGRGGTERLGGRDADGEARRQAESRQRELEARERQRDAEARGREAQARQREFDRARERGASDEFRREMQSRQRDAEARQRAIESRGRELQSRQREMELRQRQFDRQQAAERAAQQYRNRAANPEFNRAPQGRSEFQQRGNPQPQFVPRPQRIESAPPQMESRSRGGGEFRGGGGGGRPPGGGEFRGGGGRGGNPGGGEGRGGGRGGGNRRGRD